MYGTTPGYEESGRRESFRVGRCFKLESQGLLIVQVRFSHVKPDFGPEYAPDDFSNVLFQLNPPQLHARAKSASRIIQEVAPQEGGTHRQCCVACERHDH